MKTRILMFVLIATMTASCLAAGGPMTVKAVNKLSFSRPGQTIELSAKDLAPLGEKDLMRIHVKDAAGKDLLCQAVDTDGDYTPDLVIFQADFAAGESKKFTVSVGDKWVYTKDQFRAFGRFVRERFDDFCWENDRIAHRMYGKALETWVREPLTSSTVDIWSKRTPRMVINDWYMVDNYHKDTGEGADFYSAGATRGDGGNGLWAADRLWVSKNFVNSRVLANGPIRVMFELTYEPFDVNGMMVSEVKRISLDAGQNLDHFRSAYKPDKPGELITGIGLKKGLRRAPGTQSRAGLADLLGKDGKEHGNAGRGRHCRPQAVRKADRGKTGHADTGPCARGRHGLLLGRVLLGQGRSMRR